MSSIASYCVSATKEIHRVALMNFERDRKKTNVFKGFLSGSFLISDFDYLHVTYW